MKKLMILGVFLLSVLSAMAYDFEVDGLYYNRLSKTEMICEVTSGEKKYAGDIKIPTTVSYKNIEFSVSQIGEGAFFICKGLTSVSIPSSVTKIGRQAFYQCAGLTSVEIPNSVTEISSYAFSQCVGLTSVEIPNSVTEIGWSAFDWCTGLTSVSIPNSVTTIEPYAFNYCIGLTSVEIPSSVTEIGESVFRSCHSLTSVEIPSSVTKIGPHAFYQCAGLTSVSIPSSVTEIGYRAFGHCTSLKDVTFECSPSILTFDYSWDTFKDCESLTKISIGRQLQLKDDRTLYPIYEKYLSEVMRNDCISDLAILDGVNLKGFFYLNKRYLEENLATLELGKDIIGFGLHDSSVVSFNSYSKLETIICKDPIPTSDCPTFSSAQYRNIKVYVPKGSLSAYDNADGWKNFWNIVEMEESDIDSIADHSEKIEIGRYNLQGLKVSEDYKGVVIVKYSDGTTKKIISDGSAR